MCLFSKILIPFAVASLVHSSTLWPGLFLPSDEVSARLILPVSPRWPPHNPIDWIDRMFSSIRRIRCLHLDCVNMNIMNRALKLSEKRLPTLTMTHDACLRAWCEDQTLRRPAMLTRQSDPEWERFGLTIEAVGCDRLNGFFLLGIPREPRHT